MMTGSTRFLDLKTFTSVVHCIDNSFQRPDSSFDTFTSVVHCIDSLLQKPDSSCE